MQNLELRKSLKGKALLLSRFKKQMTYKKQSSPQGKTIRGIGPEMF